MPILREILDGLSKTLDSSVDWMELVRDLEAQISIQPPALDFFVRWAEKADLLALDAMQGFVKEIEFMERAHDLGDKCLLLERSGEICAFAWVTFRDYRLSLWLTMHLPLGFAYLVYVHVEPEYRRIGVGLPAELLDVIFARRRISSIDFRDVRGLGEFHPPPYQVGLQNLSEIHRKKDFEVFPLSPESD